MQIYRNDGSGRDSYVNGVASARINSFWPDPVLCFQTRRKEAVNNLPLLASPHSNRGRPGAMAASPRLHETSLSPQRPDSSLPLPLSHRPSPGSSPRNLRSLSPARLSPTNGSSGPIQSFPLYFFESTAHKDLREGRFGIGSAPPNTATLPSIRTKVQIS
jgi:hypothetical protein